MSLAHAFIGGLHNFFSLWIMCLMQVTPFIFAFFTAATLLELGEDAIGARIREASAILAACLFGFAFMYCSLGASTTAFSAFLFQYESVLLQVGGVILLLVSFYFLGILRVPEAWRKFVHLGAAFPVGAVLGLAYQPCVTATLSAIYNMIKNPDTFSRGLVALLFYSLGLITALALAASFLLYILTRKSLRKARPAVIKICGAALLIISGLILLQKMTVYKSLLVG